MQSHFINLNLDQRITTQFLSKNLENLENVDEIEYIIEHILSVLRYHTDKFKLPLPFTFIYENLEVILDCDFTDEVVISNFKVTHA